MLRITITDVCKKRNRHLVDCSSACICFLTKHEGDTAYTVDYAKQMGLDITNVVEEIEGYPAVKDSADLELVSTPQCKVRNSSYEFAMLSKNKIPRDF